MPIVVGYIPVIKLLRLGAQTGEGVKQFWYTIPSFASLSKFGVLALESPYIEKNKDWSSQTSHKKFGDSDPKQIVDIKRYIDSIYIFKFYVFYYSNLIKLIILVSLKH